MDAFQLLIETVTERCKFHCGCSRFITLMWLLSIYYFDKDLTEIFSFNKIK